jgi:hypothetical protein
MYVLRSALPEPLRAALVQDRAGDARRGLAVVVLSLLELNGGKMDGDELWRHLGQLGVRRGERHVQFDPEAELVEMEKWR